MNENDIFILKAWVWRRKISLRTRAMVSMSGELE